jgi:hypothetical protein
LNDERAATELKGATIEGPFGQNVTLLEFEQTLILWLRKNRNEPTPVNLPPQGEPFSRTQRDINIPEELIKIAKYEPAVIREIFDRLLKQLEQEHLPAE